MRSMCDADADCLGINFQSLQAGRSEVEPVTRNKMTTSAQEFESMAIGVQVSINWFRV